MTSEYLTSREVLDMLKIAKATLSKWIREDRVKAYIVAGSCRKQLFKRSEIEALITPKIVEGKPSMPPSTVPTSSSATPAEFIAGYECLVLTNSPVLTDVAHQSDATETLCETNLVVFDQELALLLNSKSPHWVEVRLARGDTSVSTSQILNRITYLENSKKSRVIPYAAKVLPFLKRELVVRQYS